MKMSFPIITLWNDLAPLHKIAKSSSSKKQAQANDLLGKQVNDTKYIIKLIMYLRLVDMQINSPVQGSQQF